MKFSDGYWMLRPGVSALGPRDIDTVEQDGRDLLVYAPTSRIQERGDTLNRPLLTVRFSSPLPDVIGVRISHHVGAVDRGPHFPLTRTDHPVRIEVPAPSGELDAGYTAGRLRPRIATDGPWRVEFVADGRVLTSSMDRSVAALSTPEGAFVREQLTLGVGETLYGLGERFGPFARNGQSVDIWNADGGTASEQAYKNVPFYLSDAGYGVFVDHAERVSFELATEVASRAQFSVPGKELQYYVVHGAD